MTTPVIRRRKKPIEVDTIQWTGTNEAELIAFTNHHFEAIPPEDRAENPEITAQVYDVLHSTWIGVYTGQHIVHGVKGEFYPIAEDVLAETYVSAVAQSAPAETALRDRIAEALMAWAERNNSPKYAAARRSETVVANAYSRADAVLPLLPASVEEHRLALSDALGLGTGAPWDAIHDRVTELALPPLGQDPVARRLGLVAEHRATVLQEEAVRIRAHCPDHLDSNSAVGSWMVCHCAVADDLERRLAVEAQQQTETPACPDPIECGHEAALGQAQQEIRRLGLMVDEYGHGASALSEKLQEARATNRRLNLRAQKLESELAAYRKAVADWKISDTSTYVPLRTLAAIAKAAGVTVPGGWELHYERVERLEAAEAEVGQMRERHKASLRRADKVNNELMAEVQRYAIGAERPVLWSVYNRMHSRAAHAEAALNRVGRIARRLAAHAVGFKDVLDASDHGPWGTTVGADIAELIEALSDQPAVVPAGAGEEPADETRAPRSDVGTEFVQQVDNPGQAALDLWETDLAQSGVDTPGCDCGHDGMGVRWHDTACIWKVGLVAEARQAIAAGEPAEAWDVPDARPGTTDHTLTRQAATVDPAMCPRCKGDNREAFALCPACAEADGRLLCPRCREDITDYAEDDHVFRTGDERPYCSSDCVIAAHRKKLPTTPPADPQPVQHAPGTAILCADCRAKGHAACMDDAEQQPRHTCHDQKSAPGHDWECQWCSTLPESITVEPEPVDEPAVSQPGKEH